LAALVLAGPTLAISLPGCASSTSNAGTTPSGQTASTVYGASGAEEAVRSFLDAAQALEYGQMRRLFEERICWASHSQAHQESIDRTRSFVINPFGGSFAADCGLARRLDNVAV